VRAETADGLARRNFTHRYPPYAVYFGSDALERTGAQLAAAGQTSCLLSTGATLGANAEAIAEIEAALAPARVGHWAGTRPQCPLETVEEAAALVRDESLDAIVAVGGGSTSDHAKAVAMLVGASPDIRTLAAGGDHYLKLGSIDHGLGIYAVPTTLSGAEVTFGGAMNLVEPPLKFIFTSESLYPDAIALDPRIFLRTPRPVLLSTGMNALNHAVERFLNAAAQPLADAQFVYAARALFECLPVVHSGEGDEWEDAVSLAMLAAHLSESTNVFAGLAHACCHVLGVRTGAEHGVLNGIVLPHAVSTLTGASRARAQALADAIGLDEELGAAIARLLAQLELPARLRDVGLDRDQIEPVIDDIAKDFSFEPGTGRDRVVAVIEGAW
jgi:alcohol dehydrogenase class IV